MSADDWYECLFCKKNLKTVEKSYGKVSYEEFTELLEENKVEHPDHNGESRTIRCDYEQYVDEKGNWCFKGRMSCALCGREWKADVKIEPTGGKKE